MADKSSTRNIPKFCSPLPASRLQQLKLQASSSTNEKTENPQKGSESLSQRPYNRPNSRPQILMKANDNHQNKTDHYSALKIKRLLPASWRVSYSQWPQTSNLFIPENS
jgi:hypothetical protein